MHKPINRDRLIAGGALRVYDEQPLLERLIDKAFPLVGMAVTVWAAVLFAAVVVSQIWHAVHHVR